MSRQLGFDAKGHTSGKTFHIFLNKQTLNLIQDRDLEILQARIAKCPKEIQNAILHQLIEIYLHRGRVVMDGCRCPSYSWRLAKHEHRSYLCNATHNLWSDMLFRNFTYEAFKTVYEKPDLTIFECLNKFWTKVALDVLYLSNTWIMGLTCLCHETYIHEAYVNDDRNAIVASGADKKALISCIEVEMDCKEAAYQVRTQNGRNEGYLRLWSKEKYTRYSMPFYHSILQDCGLQNLINIYDEPGEELDSPDHIWRQEGSVKIPWKNRQAQRGKDKRIWRYVEDIGGSRPDGSIMYQDSHDRDGKWDVGNAIIRSAIRNGSSRKAASAGARRAFVEAWIARERELVAGE